MKRQRNMQQVKESDKYPPNQTEGGGDKESTWKRIQKDDSTDDPQP